VLVVAVVLEEVAALLAAIVARKADGAELAMVSLFLAQLPAGKWPSDS
jgi:hypothetical protein